MKQNKLFLLRATDGAGVSSPEPVNDPLAMPASEVDTRFPRLQPDRVYRMSIASATLDKSEKTGGEMVTLKLATTKDEMDTDGKVLHAGFSLFHRIGVTPTEKRDGKSIARDLALVLKAVAKTTTTPRDLINNPEMLKDQIVDVKIGIQPAKDGYPESNKVSSFVIPS